MSNISSNSLFHFTPSADNLISILSNGFYPRYCLEEMVLNEESVNGTLDCALPMICFCDISLGQIKNHIETYGFYGIGMTREWATKNKLNPVMYMNSNSNLALILSAMTDHIMTSKRLGILGKKLSTEFLGVSDYIKPYEGNLFRNGKLIQGVKFYNEREWRFAPKLFNIDGITSSLSKEEYNNPVTLAQENSKLIDYKLSFVPNDIKYVFVKDSIEILAMVKALKSIKGKKYDSDTIELLTSKILTTEQIFKDF